MSKWIAAAGLLAVSSIAAAQVPPEIAEKTRAAGQTMDPASGAPYAALFGPQAWQGMTIVRDLSYGEDPLQTLDLYVPEGEGTTRPVLLFVHGGGFTRGDKHGEFYPDNITAWAAKQGMIGVNMNYRLAPAAPWPAAAEDLKAAIRWVRANTAKHGGDPDRIVLWGHSAGANHVADYVGRTEVQGTEYAGVKGAILLSPFYAEEAGEQPHAYYGTDADLQNAASIVDRLSRSPVPVFLAIAEFDPPAFKTFARAARDTLCQNPEHCPEFVELKDHNHFTEGMAVGTADTSLTAPLVQWMERHLGE